MKLLAPTLGIEQPATEALIAEVVLDLAARRDPFAILQQDNSTYMQVLWTEQGYDVEYQVGDIMHHFRLAQPVTAAQATLALQNYLVGNDTWKTRLKFVRKNIGGRHYRIGYAIGQFAGAFTRAFRKARDSNKTVQRTGASRSGQETNGTSGAAGSRR
jgi:hypothetical protein